MQEKIPLLTLAKVLLDQQEWRTKAVAVPVTGGGLCSDKMAYYTWVLSDLSFSASPTVIYPLSDLLLARVFHHP